MRVGSHVALLACLVLALAAVAQAKPAAPSGRWESQANAICKQAVAKIDKIPEPHTQAQSLKAYRQVLAITTAELASLRKLAEPAAKAKAIATMYRHVDAGLAGLRRAIAALTRNDRPGFERQVAAANTQFDAANKLAIRLGVPECAK